MTRFILFDLDGTLIDGVDDLVMAMNQLLAQHALPGLTRAELEPMLGDGARMLTKRAFAARNQSLAGDALEAAYNKFVSLYEATAYRDTYLYQDAEATLRQLHQEGWKIGLASNKPTKPCREILSILRIDDLFGVIAGGDATDVRKPDGGHLAFSLDKMGYNAARGDFAVMVGDHANDINAARAINIAAIAVAFEVDDSKAHSLGADAVLTRFSQLPDALKKIA
ncbi:phosphoglycolate phosphatase [Thalassospira profundimaris]|uniref:phosphoglycolate phosphatase n=1 Tax=Thalassospira profundimaris TaxID=502049 RepID=A0A367XLI1_9PROT|nr:HAD-IA family hydrolase [Thalassospira profundimaris]RCK53651.1 phosphoglycolate phosphatase [Thalassospira profundimaris]